jgi:hypothetical protein
LKLKRRLFNLLAALSLLLCLATAAVWVRSHYQDDEITWIHRSDTLFIATTAPDSITLEIGRQSFDLVFDDGWYRNSTGGMFSRPEARFGLHHEVFSSGMGSWNKWVVTFPLWLAALVFGFLPAVRLLVRRRGEPGTCRTCGYDLRATPDRCPECGTVPQVTRVSNPC